MPYLPMFVSFFDIGLRCSNVFLFWVTSESRLSLEAKAWGVGGKRISGMVSKVEPHPWRDMGESC